MKAFRVTGTFTMGRETAPFTLEITGKDAADAQDRVLATLGSRHRVSRHHVTVKGVTELKVADITDSAVEKRLAMGK